MSNINKPRSNFSAGNGISVRFCGEDDNNNASVDVWAMKVSEKFFTVNLILPNGAPEGARWLIGSIALSRKSGDESVWSFKDDERIKAGFHGLTYTVNHEDTTCLVFQTIGMEPKVAFVVPLLDLLQPQEPQRPMPEVIARKRAVAVNLGLGVQYTPTEELLMKHLAQKAKEEEEKRIAKIRKEKEEKRQELISGMLSRRQVTVIANGRQVTAIWVINDEWKILPPKTQVVWGEIGEDGKFYAREVFQVFKERGKEAQKRHRAEVGTGKLLAKATALPEPTSVKVVIVGDVPFEVPTFAVRDELELHQQAGLNSGVLRGVEEGGKFSLFRVSKDKLTPVTDFQVLS